MHTIGIDFGTTKTLVSRIKSRTGEPETVRLGQGTDHISTSVFILDDGRMVFGDEADDRLTDSDGVYLRGFKMKLGNSTPVYAQMNEEGELIQYMASDLVTRYLAHIRTRVQNTVFAGEPITRAIITRPVEFSPARCEELRQAAIAAGFEEVELTTEPEAAGLAFCRLNDAQAFRHSALIVDWGGGTLDFALVTREDNRIVTHPNHTAGDTTMGGERFDEMLWNYAEIKLRKQGFNTINPVAMLPIVRKSKEKLSATESTSLRLSNELSTCPPIELTQQLFDTLINESVERAAGKIMQLLEQIPAADKPEMLLLVGGSCRIPYIQRKLEEACHLPAVSWHLSREAVSLGAALWDLTTASSVPPTPSKATTAAPTTKPTSALPTPLSQPARKRPFGKIAMLGTLLTAATAAPFVYPHFSQELTHEEIDTARKNAVVQATEQIQQLASAHSELRTILSSLQNASCTKEELDTIETNIHDIKKHRNEVKSSVAIIAKDAPDSPELTALNNQLTALETLLRTAEKTLQKEKTRLATAEEEYQKSVAQAAEQTKLLTTAHSRLNTAINSLQKSSCTKEELDAIESTINDIKKLSNETQTNVAIITKNAPDSPELTALNTQLSSLETQLREADKSLNAERTRLKNQEVAYQNAIEQAKDYNNRLLSTKVSLRNALRTLKLTSVTQKDLNLDTFQDDVNDSKKLKEEIQTAMTNIENNAPNTEALANLKNNISSLEELLTETTTVLNEKKNELADYKEFLKIPTEKYAELLSTAAQSNDTKLLKWLIGAGANVNQEGGLGFTPLFYASLNGHAECVSLLIEAGALVDTAHIFMGDTPLIRAAGNGHIECVRLLINKGANINKANKALATPLHMAAKEGHSNCVELLLKHGANVNATDTTYSTPLYYAILKGDSESVKILIDKGASVTHEDKWGRTPLDVARECNETECIRLLKEAGAK